MKRSILLILLLVLCLPLFAIDVDPKFDKAVRAAVPVCADATISYEEIAIKLPAHFRGALVRTESEHPTCSGQQTAVQSPAGASSSAPSGRSSTRRGRPSKRSWPPSRWATCVW